MREIDLPQGWVTTTVGHVLLNVVGGGTPSRNVPAYFNGDIPWFTVKDMKSLRPRDAQEHISAAAIAESATNLIPANTLIVATRIALGRAMRPLVPCAINQDLKALFFGDGINSDYMLLWVGANERKIQDLGSGTTVSGIRLEALHGLPLLLPPAAEQTRIVGKLEELLSDLDAGVAELKAAQRKLAQYRQSLLKAGVEGALTAGWRTRRTPAESGAQLLERILTERRARWQARQQAKFAEQGKTPPKDWQAKYPEPVAPDTTGLPELPLGWVWASLDQLALDSSYGTSVKCSYESQGASVLRIPNVIARKLVLDDLKFASQPLNLEKSEYLAPGDILIVRTNGSISLVGRAAEVTDPLPGGFYFASYLLRVRCLETSVVHRWVSALLASSQGRSWIESRAASSAGQHNLSLSTLLTIPVPLPPATEQAEALNALEAALLSVSEQERFLDKSLQQSTAQRKNILQAAFCGQLVPQDPADEPASALLARIRAERAAQGKAPKARKPRAAHDAPDFKAPA